MKSNLELATEIVISMINSGKFTRCDNSNYNKAITNALDDVFNKLDELNNRPSKSYINSSNDETTTNVE